MEFSEYGRSSVYAKFNGIQGAKSGYKIENTIRGMRKITPIFRWENLYKKCSCLTIPFREKNIVFPSSTFKYEFVYIYIG
mmetsp:Transcript_14652/g.16295  ORF Transcript_14652/g.16295 Transcript_14652/m.16295 type:complete len:80 (-) Transcript_14652:13-252(-)